jgi:hypothetical protein
LSFEGFTVMGIDTRPSGMWGRAMCIWIQIIRNTLLFMLKNKQI